MTRVSRRLASPVGHDAMIVHLVAGAARASVDPAHGGRLSSLVVGGRERLITGPPPDAALPGISWGSFPMLPWVGRMSDGRLEWDGASHDLPRNHGGHAIHGVAFDAAWEVTFADACRVDLRRRLGTSDGWPYVGEVIQTVELAPDSIAFEIRVEADVPMPVAVGWHPWFRREGVEPMTVMVSSSRVLETRDDLIPTGAVLPVVGHTDLRGGPIVNGRHLDHAYVDVDGPARLTWDDLALEIDAEPLGAFLVHTTPTAVCVEPQTAWPDAIRLSGAGLPAGMAIARPGIPFVATSRWTWHATGPDGARGPIIER